MLKEFYTSLVLKQLIKNSLLNKVVLPIKTVFFFLFNAILKRQSFGFLFWFYFFLYLRAAVFFFSEFVKEVKKNVKIGFFIKKL